MSVSVYLTIDCGMEIRRDDANSLKVRVLPHIHTLQKKLVTVML